MSNGYWGDKNKEEYWLYLFTLSLCVMWKFEYGQIQIWAEMKQAN